MIITRTPYRISFFGGGTDYPAWYREYGGAVLGTTIDKFCWISCRKLPPFFKHKHRIVYSQIETVNDFSEINHPAVREVLRFMNPESGLEINHDGDLPARSGLGSSSSFTVGLITALRALRGERIPKKELAENALHVEQNLIREAVGSQDQIMAAYGGLNRVDFRQDGSFDVSPFILSKERKAELHSRMLLFFTGFSRIAATIAEAKISNFQNRKTELLTMKELVEEASQVLRSKTQSVDQIGSLLHETWKLKRALSDKVSNPMIDEIYETGLSAGALGGKILGAGGGGFILFFAKPDLHDRIRDRLRSLLHVSFNLEDSGSRVVLYDPQL